jgi:hypothetical protein
MDMPLARLVNHFIAKLLIVFVVQVDKKLGLPALTFSELSPYNLQALVR